MKVTDNNVTPMMSQPIAPGNAYEMDRPVFILPTLAEFLL